jgi:hypothetical protein
MGDAAVTPVEDEVPAVLDEHVSVVEVVVLDRLRDPVVGQPAACRHDVWEEGTHPRVLLAGQAAGAAEQEGVLVLQQLLEARGEGGEALVGDPGRKQRVDRRSGGELQLGVGRERLVEVTEVGARPDELPQPGPAVAHQQPAVVGVDGDELGDAAGPDPLQHCEQRGLEGVRRRVRLEPEVSVVGRHAQNGRPPANVRLLDPADELEAALVEARSDPGGRAGEPGGLDPEEARIGRQGRRRRA